RGAVGHGGARVARGQDVALEEGERLRVAALVQREHRLVPGKVAVEVSAPVVAGHPVVQERGARLDVERLERDVGQVVGRARVARVLIERRLGQPPRLVEAVHLVIGEGERGLEPPVVAVGRGEALQESHAVLLAIAPAGQGDRAARLVDEHRVAGELLHVLVHQREAARGLARDEGADRLDVLPLAPGGAVHGLAGAPGGGPRGRAVALHRGEKREPHVSQGQPLVGRERGREALLGSGAVGEEIVHALLEAVEGGGRRRGDGQAVAVGGGHGSHVNRARGSSIKSASAPRNWAPRAPSRARWSQERVRVMVGCTAGCPFTGTTRSAMRPTARIAACGGLTMALNASTPYIPRLLIVNTPPWMSAGRSLPACARVTRSSRRAAMSLRPSESARAMTGTTRPSSSATARPMLISVCRSSVPSFHETFTRGCCASMAATSFTSRSEYVMCAPVCLRAVPSQAWSRATLTSRAR